MNDNINNTNLVPAICSQCGGQNEVNPSQENVVCNYCGTSFFVEKGIQTYNVHNAKVEHVYSMNFKGPVESVLTFVEKQQDKKQQKIDEEKRRLEEEKRKQKERDKEIINQLFNKQYRKRNLVILGVFSVVILMCSCLGILNFMGKSSGAPDTIVKINPPASSSELEGENYQDVVARFENAGFTNIQTKLIDDLVLGWFTKDGEVEVVSVDGSTSFSTSSSYPEDVPIVVSYHTFPEKELEEIVEDDVKSEESISTVETPAKTEKVVTVETQAVTEKVVTVKTQAVTEKVVTVESVEEDYSDINQLIFEDLLQAQGWAIGALDRDGNPTENGTPSPAFAFSLYIDNITYLGDKLRISVFPEFVRLNDEDKTNIANTVQYMVKVHTNNIPYTTIRLNGNVIGNSKLTNTQAFKWD